MNNYFTKHVVCWWVRHRVPVSSYLLQIVTWMLLSLVISFCWYLIFCSDLLDANPEAEFEFIQYAWSIFWSFFLITHKSKVMFMWPKTKNGLWNQKVSRWRRRRTYLPYLFGSSRRSITGAYKIAQCTIYNKGFY